MTSCTINSNGMKEALLEGVNLGEKDFSALVSKIKASGADARLLGRAAHRRRADRAPDARPGRQGPADGGDGITSDEFAIGRRPRRRRHADDLRRPIRASGRGEGDRGEIPRQESSSRKLHALQLRGGTRSSSRPPKQAKSLDPKKVAEQIRSGKKFKTVIGELSFDKKGDITRPDYVMYVWKKDASGKITYVEKR